MRITPIITCAVAFVLLFGVACGGDDDSNSDAGSSDSATSPTESAAPSDTQAPAEAEPTDEPELAPTDEPAPSTNFADTPVKAQLSITYKVPPGGAAPPEELPFPAGSVEARWYVSGDRYVVHYAGLILDGDPPLCPGNSIQVATGFMHISNSPAEPGACEGAQTLPTEGTAGVMLCGDEVLYVTQIPAGTEGILFGTIEVFLADGAILGLTSQSPTNLGEAPPVDLGACEGPLR